MSANDLPFSLDIISECMESFEPPAGPFDPNGRWDHRYVMWIALRGPAGKSRAYGGLRIRRADEAAGASRLDIDQITGYSGVRREHIRLGMTVKNDRLSTPLNWSGKSWIPGSDAGISRCEITGEVSGGKIRRGNTRYVVDAPKSLSTNWSLFDAVQRMPFYSGPFTFDMLEDMDVLKSGQRIVYRKPVEVELGGRTVRLHSFEQTGRGILPYTYWLDDQHRLLFAIGGLRTFLWDPKVDIPEDQA